ncbi:hypothetical protein [Thalassorhabdomicrobium marinisediminis]|uniref:Aspartate carbamoyltransferase catalytic subunit n=1 Tax=Thalassorhabdomicrobium marinisediminis TaxID=2170577 RepID=A0A2T7FYT9_9RHOB|nr:hypothetical protein [Thalassorhabdomicrobium marinisediminis]PVA07334.1 hypothetical protein DC363_05675 [Thalassorhabdomicrobium marinisediminis]
MTETVTDYEHGRTRVFHLDHTTGAPESATVSDLQAALGVDQMDAAHVQRVVISDLGDMTLSQFLASGYDTNPAKLAARENALNALTGVAFIVRSAAFPERPVTLNTEGDADLVATFDDPAVVDAFTPEIESPSAEGILTPPPVKSPPSDKAMAGRVAMIALLVMALLVLVIVLIA